MKYLPEPDYIPGEGINGYATCVTPYTSNNWKNVIATYGVQVPEIIDMTMGKSKCLGCGVVYTGYQPRCTLSIVFHSPPGSWHPTRGYHPNYLLLNKSCDGRLDWDLMEKFRLQQEFFSLLDQINCLPSLDYDPLYKFSSHFPPGVPEALRTRLVAQEIEFQVRNIQRALSEIATKMNNAGACLSFNF